MLSIKYSRRANADLEDITDYTARTWGAQQAKKYIREIKAKIQDIAKGDAITHSLDGVEGKLFQVRASRHLIICEEKLGVLFVVRILHVSMDIPRHVSGSH